MTATASDAGASRRLHDAAVVVIVTSARQQLVDLLIAERFGIGRLGDPPPPAWPVVLPDHPAVTATRRRLLCEAMDGRYLRSIPDPLPTTAAA